MNYKTFVAKAEAQDGRNSFAKYAGNLDIVPEDVRPFYREHNPVDVEVDVGGIGVRLCPADELVELQRQYAYINAQFVFATCNGDPIFLNEGQVYTRPHGADEPKWEKLAESAFSYFERLID
jgi:hypothetical protein